MSMLKKLLITGCTLLLLTACGTDQTKENGSTTNQTNTTSEANTTNQTETNNESTAVKDSSNAKYTKHVHNYGHNQSDCF